MSLSHLIGGFVLRHWRAYAASGAMLAAIAALGVWLPRQVGALVDGLVAQTMSGPALWREIGWLLAAGVAIYGLRVAWRLVLFATAYRLGVELRLRMYERLTLQGASFFQQHRTGDLMALATNDIDAVEMAAGEAMLAGFDGTLTLMLVVGMMTLGVDWRLGLVVLLPFPAMGWAFWKISNQVHSASREALQAFGALNDQVQESLSGVRTLRSLGLEARESARFAGLADAAARTSLAAQRSEANFEPAVGLTLSTAVALSLAFGGWLVWRGEMTVGQLTSFGMYLGQLIWPMFAAGWVLSLIERGRAAWARLAPVLEAPLSIDDHGRHAAAPAGAIVFEGVGFRYPGQTAPALADVAFTLPPGRTLGIVGATGSGKSTLMKLLLRQWTPEAGRIRWGDVALADFSLATLRQHMAWVAQEPFLFSASVAQNIALAAPQATQRQIEQAAGWASVHEDIAQLPHGYQTPVGERGVTLSGGQRQRVAIARALAVDAPLLLLDDSLSAVDTETETRIRLALQSQRQGRSVVIVSHRLSTVADADEIIVLRHGRIVERGTHAELLATPGWYARQWRVQQLEASLDDD